ELNVNGDFQQRPDAAHHDASRPDVAIVVFGENPYAEFQGDIPSAEYSPGAKPDLALLRKLRSAGIPVVSVFLSGRPLWVNPEINASDAFVAAWLPGTEGGGIADVLFKAPDGSIPFDFHGKLSFSWPRTPQQTAAVLGAGDSPLFPYDFGLRYHDNGDLKKLPEDLGTGNATAIDTHVFFAAGRPGAGWSWVAAGGGLTMSAADKSAQEDARLLSWSGVATAWAGLTGANPIDLQRETNGQLSLAFDYKANSLLTANVTLRLDCGTGCQGGVPITHELAGTAPGQWGHLKMPLACFTRAGADMSHITTPFALETSEKLALTVANIRLESGTDGIAPCANGPAFR
ncbi:MAG TPA: putative glycoside hydrolase, partial [Steroidobacteraceae bacterium]